MTEQLARVTEVPYEVLYQKVQEVLSVQGAANELEVAALAERTILQLKRAPRNAGAILAGLQVELARLTQQVRGINTHSVVSTIDETFVQFEEVSSEVGLVTGWPLFDKWFGGI